MKKYSILLTLFICYNLLGQNNQVIDPFNYSISKNDTFSKGSVASAHPLASLYGVKMMQEGGNAFDAAITSQLVLAVVYPAAGNIGGGGFMVAKTGNKFLALDYREKAPSKAFEQMYWDENGNPILEKSQKSALASGVPGTIAGIFETVQFTKLPFKQLIQPAIDVAENGFAITEREANSLNKLAVEFKKYNHHITAFQQKNNWQKGDTLIQKELANTLKRIRDFGLKGFYEGETADYIVKEMKKGNGIISKEDLKNYKAVWRKPLITNYKGYEIVGMPPPSSGGIIVAQLLKMVEDKNLDSKIFGSTESVQLMIEAERRAYADRAEHMGDPDFVKVPVETLISNSYLKERMKDYDSTKASLSKNINAGSIKESEETTHISIIDKEGNMVAITTTLNDSYGSKTVVAGAGFLLNNEMDDFSIKPGVPNMYGAVGGKANAIAPNKRMLSSMTPTLVLKNKKPFLVVGTPGGTTIPTSVFQSIVNIIDFNLSAFDAVNLPKFHHQWLPDEVFFEKDFNKKTISELAKMGYTIKYREAIGRVELLKINNNFIEAVADKRGDDSVAGY
ncbi:MAG: gamma-glutamyltransferase [Chitinophagaceae bacterium]|nr:gamma-glutamyltransferase [Chitinophagaceae bacterium]